MSSTDILPLVAIRCIAYNQEAYIRKCLDGFVMQKTNFKYVVVIHDDASLDNTAEIIREYEEKSPDIIIPIYETENQYSKEGNPLGRIMLDAINNTGAKYVALCEGDDYWTDPNKLQKQVDFLESHPDYSMCFHRAKIEYEGIQGVRILCEQVEDRDYSPNELLRDWYIPTASIVCRKECYDVPLVDSEKFVNGDVILMLKCATLGKIHGFADSMSVYRVHSAGVSYDKNRQKFYSQRFVDHYKCIKKNFPFLDKKVANARISHGYYVRAVHPNNIFTCARDLFLAFCYSPSEFVKSLQNAIHKRVK